MPFDHKVVSLFILNSFYVDQLVVVNKNLIFTSHFPTRCL